ncbi:MAG: hypothetical protein IAF38_09805 [Bacteroidia bacterium]|nr:hypothetical protein [Bacteroidia bacterium]
MTIEIKEPETLTEVKISEETKEELKQFSLEEGQVIVHCLFPPNEDDFFIRVWQTTFLIDRTSSHKSGLLHAEAITLFPDWTHVPAQTAKRFTLIFSRLPSSCKVFDLVEEIPQSGGFFVNGIVRSSTDVYEVKLQ